MLKIKNVLVPTDFSSCAEHAVAYGVDVARTSGARLHLLHVVDEGLFGPPYIPQGGFVYPIDRVELYRRLDDMKDKYPDLTIETVVAMGDPADEIVRYAEDNEIELKEGDYVTNIEMVDDDWWMGQSVTGKTGLFPANYVELVEEEEHSAPHAEPQAAHAEPSAAHGEAKKTATAQYDYEAAEDNELSFPDGAKITNVVSISRS